MAKINKYWGYVAIGALTAAAAGAVAALIAKKGSCKEDFDFEDDFDDFDLTDEKETAKEDQNLPKISVLGTYRRTVCNR